MGIKWPFLLIYLGTLFFSRLSNSNWTVQDEGKVQFYVWETPRAMTPSGLCTLNVTNGLRRALAKPLGQKKSHS